MTIHATSFSDALENIQHETNVPLTLPYGQAHRYYVITSLLELYLLTSKKVKNNKIKKKYSKKNCICVYEFV